MSSIDINFDVYSDTPEGKDPDSFSSTLRDYHKLLWSKSLPNKKKFYLDIDIPKLLHHQSKVGEFFLSSDSIGHTYSRVKKMSHIIKEIFLFSFSFEIVSIFCSDEQISYCRVVTTLN